MAGTSPPGPCPRAEPGSLQRRALGAPGLSRALTRLPRGAAAPSRKGLRCRGARTGRPHHPSPGHGASTSTQCPLVGTISLPGDTRLPRKRDVPFLGAVPGDAFCSPSSGRDRETGRARGAGSSHPRPHVTGERGRHTAGTSTCPCASAVGLPVTYPTITLTPPILTPPIAQCGLFPTQPPGAGGPVPFHQSPGLALGRGRSNTRLFCLGEGP